MHESSIDRRAYNEQRFASLPRIHFRMLSNPVELVHFQESIEKREPYTVRHMELSKYNFERRSTTKHSSRKLSAMPSDLTSGASGAALSTNRSPKRTEESVYNTQTRTNWNTHK